MSVNPETGATRYYEFGRYPPDKDNGVVRRRPVPDLEIGPNGQPTQESLDHLYDTLSKKYGKDSSISADYYPDTDFNATINFAERFDPTETPYSLIGNNCKTFGQAAAQACKEGETCPD